MNPRTDELIALAALGELTPDETAELDAAVAADPGLAAELAEALTSAAMLQAGPVEQPPARLRASVLGAIAGVEQDSTVPSVVTPLPGAADDGTSWVTHTKPPRRRRFAPLLAAAAVLVLVAGGVIIATGDRGGDDPIAAVIEADDADSLAVTGAIGDLELVYSAREDAFVLVGESLTPAPTDSTYQVWLVDDGGATPVGTFEPDSDGDVAMRADGFDPTGSTIGITVEPVGGSDVPTLPLVAQSA
jgi:anti-sigma-K factor RskA